MFLCILWQRTAVALVLQPRGVPNGVEGTLVLHGCRGFAYIFSAEELSRNSGKLPQAHRLLQLPPLLHLPHCYLAVEGWPAVNASVESPG